MMVWYTTFYMFYIAETESNIYKYLYTVLHAVCVIAECTLNYTSTGKASLIIIAIER